jgi:hypothetical protein
VSPKYKRPLPLRACERDDVQRKHHRHLGPADPALGTIWVFTTVIRVRSYSRLDKTNSGSRLNLSRSTLGFDTAVDTTAATDFGQFAAYNEPKRVANARLPDITCAAPEINSFTASSRERPSREGPVLRQL